MTAAFLQSELTTLISDSKRKHAEVRTAAEKSLNELKSISVTSETQLAGDLIRKSHFIDPFILACKSQNTKLASNGAACLQRLVASTAIPRPRLLDLLQAFEEAVPLTLEVQLKILQTLPSLLQLYATDLHGEALSRTLSVCADLSSNKLPMVSSTASATFQQLLTSVFTHATTASTQNRSRSEGQSLRESDDAASVFKDLCALLSGDQLEFIRLERLPPPLILETIESLLSTYSSFLVSESDALKACAECLIPGLSTLIENSANYTVVVRAFRIAFILANQYLTHLTKPLPGLLKVLLKVADRGSSHKWKRILSLEFCRGFCSDFEGLRRSFAAYDMVEGGFPFVADLMASLVRIASEDPTLIGLGRQSTIPSAITEETGGDLTTVTENPVNVGSIAQAEAPSIGISVQASSIPTPCLDQYDKNTPPEIPETYIFTLVLGCISAFSDGLSKYIMPLSIPNHKMSVIANEEHDDPDDMQPQRKSSSRGHPASNKWQQLINPLTRPDLGRHAGVGECARMIETCWPAVLATCSTFLNAALDSYFYHMLIRTVQKLTQVSGVLELNTPRDALLTTLAKVSVPANVSSLMNTLYGDKPAYQPGAEGPYPEEDSVKAPVASTPRHSIDLTSQSLNVRNLLCLRALLNLGIALGPTLSGSAWKIVWQSLEQVEALMSVNPSSKFTSGGSSAPGDNNSASTLASEIAAVDTARRKMIESTTAYSDAAFDMVCRSLFDMIDDVVQSYGQLSKNAITPVSTLRPNFPAHKSTRSVSGNWAKSTTLEIEVQFVLKFIGRLASVNLHRFRHAESGPISWNSIVSTLSLLQSNRSLQPHLRLQCANIIDAIVVGSCTSGNDEDDGEDTTSLIIQTHCIPALRKQIDNIQYASSNLHRSADVEVQTVLLMLEALHNLISSSGEELDHGWRGVFDILNAAISHQTLKTTIEPIGARPSAPDGPIKLYSAAFKVTLLITSDFLSRLDDECVVDLLAMLRAFGSQKVDLNMSLTTIALYWNVAGLFGDRTELLTPFASEVEMPKTGPDTKILPNLWQATISSLQEHCKDSRSESRNAAVRMLAKIVETSMPEMSPDTLNSYYTAVPLSLLSFYAQKQNESNGAWTDSALDVLQDLVVATTANASLLANGDAFRQTWSRLLVSTGALLRMKDVTTVLRVFNALTEITSCLFPLTASIADNSQRSLLEQGWSLWLAKDPTQMKLEGQRQDVFAAHSRFLLALANWNLRDLSSFENARAKIAENVKRTIYEAVHEAYTVDISKVSAEQEQALCVLDILQQLSTAQQTGYVLVLLSFIDNMMLRTIAAYEGGAPAAPTKGTRQPTGIAFVTACIERLRKLLSSEAAPGGPLAGCPFTSILKSCTRLIATKYSSLPVNTKTPLWQQGTLLAVQSVQIIDTISKDHLEELSLEDLVSTMSDVANAIMGIPHLDARAPGSLPPKEAILLDEDFDIHQLKALHLATQSLLDRNATSVSQSSLTKYILTLFHHSLIARPWYNDLTPNIEQNPLSNLNKIRPGSIRDPDLKIRQNISCEALRCLFSLVAASFPSDHDSISAPTEDPTPRTILLSTLAAPYILLRFSHTLKTFLADQPLRHLQHPHRALQHELHTILRAFIDLRVSGDAFLPVIEQLNLARDTVRNDGKTHLRIMASLARRFEECWKEMPRLKRGLAWQECEDGVGVERCLAEWRGLLTEGATVGFE